ncbi:MAG TPA: hypothetical protein PLG77_10385 [Burkholderiaceae bacterium]|nr:hypothetical protein [Burkholderiaceae bacterium]HRP28822.1 hypothetical protein [Burkholderiaceae bacterium]
MQFEECTEGPYRIYAGALEAPRGEGYIAALVVKRIEPGAPRGHETFRDESLACGYQWRTARDALFYAMRRARQIISRQAAD